jgi:hypothetical protein
MKKGVHIIIIGIFCLLNNCFILKTVAQNLLPNHSFEVVDTCPLAYNFLYLASPWFNPNTIDYGTPDLFNACAPTGFGVDVPTNSVGSQSPKTGNGYAGIACVVDTQNLREYIEVPLISPLISGQQYCIEFYVSLADKCSLATSNIGAYFSVDSLLDASSGNAISYVTPQISNANSNIIIDKVNWSKIFGTFIAQGGERFMSIGNFFSPVNTNTQSVSAGIFPLAYYYIDDIFVTACDTVLIGINEINNKKNNFNLFPNPNDGTMNFIYTLKEKENGAFEIYDISGRIIQTYRLQTGANNQLFINATQLNSGVYFYKVIIDGQIEKSDKLIIIK